MADHDDDYRSSDDEDYIPETAADDVEDESEGDDVDEVTGADGEILSGKRRAAGKEMTKKKAKKEKPVEADSSVDVDALFAAMLEEDARLLPKPIDQPSTSDDSKSKEALSDAKTEMKTVTEVFDFAGEEVSVEKKVTAEEFDRLEEEKKKAVERDGKKPTQKRVGLGDALTLLKKKPKMSVLDKSNHDWDNFKKENDLQEELQTFNRGKHGFVEKSQFLARTDLREFENEKHLRKTARK